MMNDLISRSALVAELESFKNSLGDVFFMMIVNQIIRRVEQMPAAEGVPSK